MKKSLIIDILVCILIVAGGIILRSLGNGVAYFPEDMIEGFVDDDGVGYLSDTDSYLYLRYAEEIAAGKDIAGINRETDSLMTTTYKMSDEAVNTAGFPIGMSYIGAAAITIAGWFGYNNSVAVCSFLSMLLASLAAVPAYVFTRRRTNTWGAIAAGVSATLAISFVSHTVTGFFDTDCVLAVFPLTMMCCYAESLFADKAWKSYTWIVAGSIAFMGIAWVWSNYTGYYFILFGCCLVLGVGSLIWPHLFPRKNIKPLLIIFGTATVIALIIGGTGIIADILSILNRYSDSASAGDGLAKSFPAATLFTSELSDIDLISGGIRGTFNVANYGIINRLGGFGLVVAVLVIMVVGYILSILAMRKQKDATYSLADSPNQRRRSITILQIEAEKKRRKIEVSRDLRIEWAVELAIFGTWLLGTLLMLSRGVRFIELPALPLAVVFGLGIGHLTKSIKDNNIDKLAAQFLYMACSLVICGSLIQWNEGWALIIGMIIFVFGILIRNKLNILLILMLSCSMLISPVLGTVTIAKGSVPTVTDAFADASKWIKDNTKESAVLASWWDYGYYFEEAAQRRCIADPGTTNGEMFYYLGNALMNSDPEKAAETLRMLADYKTEGDDLYLIISRDMLEKLGAIGYFGTWDFDKQEGTSGYFYSTLYSVEVPAGNSISVAFPTLDGYGVNYTIAQDGAMNFSFVDKNGKSQDISRLMVVQDGKIIHDKEVEHDYDQAPGLIIMSEKGRYSAALVSQNAMNSMMVKLFVTDGSFTKVFERVNTSTLNTEGVKNESEIQKLLGNYLINASSTTGLVVYKVNK